MNKVNKVEINDIDRNKVTLTELKKLKESFPGHKEEDLLRFLIIQNNNYTLAYLMYRNHLDWLKKTNRPTKDQIRSCLEKKWCFVHGHDREDHPLLIIKINRHLKNETNIEELIMEQLWWFDHVCNSL